MDLSPQDITPEVLTAIAGVVLSLLFSYVPGLNVWFDSLGAGKGPDGADEDTPKQLFMAGLLLVVCLAIFGLSCWGVMAAVSCDRPGLIGLVWVYILALMSNQGIHRISPKAGAVLEARKARIENAQIVGRG